MTGRDRAGSSAAHLEVFAEFRFEAAHQLPGVPADHMCARLHGHSYAVRVSVIGHIEPATGWVIDYGAITAAMDPLRAQLDHRCLNDISGLENPTSENLAMWLWQHLRPALPGLHAVEVREMPGLGCIYRGQD